MTRPGHDLLELLGEPAYVALAEAFGGTRLYVPSRIGPDHAIVAAIGAAAARRLSEHYAPDVVTVPLARDLRVRHYLACGLTAAQIARKFGMGERGVFRMIARLRAGGELPERAAALPLFPEI